MLASVAAAPEHTDAAAPASFARIPPACPHPMSPFVSAPCGRCNSTLHPAVEAGMQPDGAELSAVQVGEKAAASHDCSLRCGMKARADPRSTVWCPPRRQLLDVFSTSAPAARQRSPQEAKILAGGLPGTPRGCQAMQSCHDSGRPVPLALPLGRRPPGGVHAPEHLLGLRALRGRRPRAPQLPDKERPGGAHCHTPALHGLPRCGLSTSVLGPGQRGS
jgi:hypothetical protein